VTLVIYNSNAGKKRVGPRAQRPGRADEVRDLLARHGVDAEVRESRSGDAARALVREAVARRDPMVVAAGGDGTIGLVASELLGCETALGILPLGSVMNVPRMLGLPSDPEEAAAVLTGGRRRAIDVGYAGERPFLETGSVGMNAAIFSQADRFGEGDWASIVRTIWVAIRFRPARMRIELDDRTLQTRALMVTASNGPYAGVGLAIAPDAKLDDGLFDVGVYRRFSKVELLRHLASIAFGRRKYTPQLETFRSARVRVSSARPLPCRADSQDLGTTPVEFVTRARALRVVAPDRDTGNTPTA
jgi:YegS/Rv2252/BmrU family lipid kinase